MSRAGGPISGLRSGAGGTWNERRRNAVFVPPLGRRLLQAGGRVSFWWWVFGGLGVIAAAVVVFLVLDRIDRWRTWRAVKKARRLR